MKKLLLAWIAAVVGTSNADAAVVYSLVGDDESALIFTSDDFLPASGFHFIDHSSLSTCKFFLVECDNAVYDHSGGADILMLLKPSYTSPKFAFAAGTFGQTGTFQTLPTSTFAGSLTISQDAVPEPASWVTMAGGLLLVGAAMRRRRGAPIAYAERNCGS